MTRAAQTHSGNKDAEHVFVLSNQALSLIAQEMGRREGLYSMKTITKDPPDGTGPPSGMLPGFQGSRLFT